MRAQYGIIAGAVLVVTLALIALAAGIAPRAVPSLVVTPQLTPAITQSPNHSITQSPAPTAETPLPSPTATPAPTVTPSATATRRPATTVEMRALWITRFDGTCAVDDPEHPCPPDGQLPGPDTVRQMVANADEAGFNTLLFQVRGNGDAYYTPGLEPWAARLTGTFSNTLGQNPGWDPLAVLLDEAHARGMRVQAYFNTYPTWLGAGPPRADTVPQHPYWQWSGAAGNDLSWLVWGGDHVPMQFNDGYIWASPADTMVQDHLVATAADILKRYPLDGLHLDLARYPGGGYSCDPASEARWGACPAAIAGTGYADGQRAAVTALVQRMRDEVAVPLGRHVWLDAAVWWYPYDTYGLNCTAGYDNYYQDSYGWLAQGAIDAEFPMLYGCSAFGAGEEGDEAWTTVMHGWLDHRAGGSVFPGIHADEISWDSIVARIDAERAYAASAGAVPGHAIFSYSYVAAHDYWAAFANGPYAERAAAPLPEGHP